jgi:hypothetical protein
MRIDDYISRIEKGQDARYQLRKYEEHNFETARASHLRSAADMFFRSGKTSTPN